MMKQKKDSTGSEAKEISRGSEMVLQRIQEQNSPSENQMEVAQRETSEQGLPQEMTGILLEWYHCNRRILPWREDPSPYHVWVSEIMLQQTRVEAVKDYYDRFLKRLPRLSDLAKVEEDELMKLWQGLGYYNRARNLQKAAQSIMEDLEGEFPHTFQELQKLPGIGEYTAGAIASIAFGQQVPAVDGNMYRIITRILGDPSDITKALTKRRITQIITGLLPKERPGDFNQAMMDLGATICLPNGMPKCNSCPWGEYCRAKALGTMTDYPVKPDKKPRKIQERTILILKREGQYYLQKRPDKGLLAGLWEFPGQEGHLSLDQLQTYFHNHGVSWEEVGLLGKAKHIFSHIEWRMLGYVVELSDIPGEFLQESGIWATVEELENNYGIPSAFQFYYEKILRNSSLQ